MSKTSINYLEDEVRGFSGGTSGVAGSSVGIPNRRNCTTPNNHGFSMTTIWFLMVALVLGGLLASLWYQETRRGIWFRKVRVRVPARRARGAIARSAQRRLTSERLSPPGLIARAGPRGRFFE